MSDLFDKAIPIAVERSRWYPRKNLRPDEFETDAAKTRVRASKSLIDSDELYEIYVFDRGITDWMQRHCRESYFRNGIFLVPIGMLNQVETRLTELSERRAKLVDAFVASYPAAKERAKRPKAEGGLGTLYHEADYPTQEEVRAAFGFNYVYIDLGVPERLAKISQAAFGKAVSRSEKQFAKMQQEMRDGFRATFLELLEHIVGLIGGKNKKGNAKALRDGSLDGLRQFVDSFDVRNIG